MSHSLSEMMKVRETHQITAHYGLVLIALLNSDECVDHKRNLNPKSHFMSFVFPDS